MGASQSRTRKLTVENDDPTSVIKVSDDVVQRIRNNQETKGDQSYQQPQSVEVPVITQPTFIYEPSVTTVQLRQANVQELKKNDRYWEERLKNLQSSHKKINEIMEQEYNKAIGELEGKKQCVEAKCLPPCQDTKKAVMKCYKQYPNEPMRCAKEVSEFQRCVDQKRLDLISNRENPSTEK